MTRTRTRRRAVRPAAARPLGTALTLSTVVFLSACTSSADIEAEARADAAAEAGATAAVVEVDTGPNPNAVYQQSVGDVEIVGTVNAGWPNTTYVAATSLKGNGLVDAFEAALQHVFEDGTYAQTLERWGLSDEAVDEPVVNPAVGS
jgi:polar amino acid transport system substrate-binding protein